MDKEVLHLKARHFEEMFRKKGRLIVAPLFHHNIRYIRLYKLRTLGAGKPFIKN